MWCIQKELAIKYPYIFPINENLKEYYGYIELLNGKTAEFSLKIPNYPMATNCTLDINENSIITNELNCIDTTNLTLTQYLDKLSYILCKSVPPYYSQWTNFGMAYHNLIQELINFQEQPLGTSKWSLDQSDNSKICMTLIDDHYQTHQLIINIDLKVGDDKFFTVSKHNLPQYSNGLPVFVSCDSLKCIYEKLNQSLKDLQDFFVALKTLDEMCWILDPKEPNGSENYRVIVANENGENKVYMTVTLNAWNMDLAPDVRICGHEALTKTLNSNIKENLTETTWWNRKDILTSLLRLLNVPFFPTPPVDISNDNSSKALSQEAVYECAICYQGFDDQPSIACTPRCKSYYHIQCLCTWFRSTNGTLCFNTLYQGQCPNCEEVIKYFMSFAVLREETQFNCE